MNTKLTPSTTVVVELRAAEGGHDSRLLVQDLARVYLKWAEACG